MPVESTPTIRWDEPQSGDPDVVPTVELARREDVEPVLRAAQALVASLRQRRDQAAQTAQAAEADLAELEGPGGRQSFEAEQTARLVDLEDEAAARRARGAEQLTIARRQAAEVVAAARAEAVVAVQAASADLHRRLTELATTTPAVAPLADVPETPAWSDNPPGDPLASESPDDPPSQPPSPPPAEPPVPPTPPPPAASVPDTPAAPSSPQGQPPYLMFIPPSEAAPQGGYVWAVTAPVAPGLPAGVPPVSGVAGAYVAGAPYMPGTYPGVGHGQPPAPPTGADAATAGRSRRGLGRLLHADVVLPLIAVVIVLFVLLAWLG